jgi:hypothetical protein
MKRFIQLPAVILCLQLAAAGHAADTRQDFLRLLSRPSAPLSPQVEELPATNGFLQIHFAFAAEAYPHS